MQFTQGSLQMTSGLRKLDLGAGKGLAVANGIGGSSSNQPSFYQTQNLNQMPQQTPGYLQNSTQQPNILQDDINQRQGPMSFGATMNSFGGNNAAFNRQSQSNILNQSIESSSSAASSQSSNFNSPQNPGAGIMSSNVFIKGGMMQSGFNQNRQTANVFQYGAQTPGIGQSSQNHQFSNQFNQLPSQYSTISSAQSDYQDTQYRTPSQVQTTPFQYMNSGPKSMIPPQQNGLLMHQDSFNKGFKFNQTIYENPVVIRVKSPDREEYDQQFMIKLALHAQSTTSQQQLLTLEVTDELNPYFLYSLECLETDFHLIKQGQQLHFDYQTFPHYIADQLEKCMACFKQDQPMQTLRRYVCQLQIGVSNEAVLAFIEQTQYQSLVVLNLKLKQGNDDSIKKHLACKLKEQKEINESLRNNLFNLEDQFSKLKTESDQLRESSQRNQEQLISELNSLKDENKRIVSQLKLEEEKKLHELREKTLLENTENQARTEAEKRNYMSQQEKTIKDLNEQRQQLMSQYEQQIQDQKAAFQIQIQNQIKETQVIVNQVNDSWESKFVAYEQTILRMQENHQKAMLSMQEKIEKRELLIDERKEIDFNNKELRTKIDSLMHEIDQMNIAHQSTKDTTGNQIKFKDAEIDMLKNELSYLRDTNKGLDTFKFSQEKHLTELQLKQQSHDREVQDKQEIIDRIQALFESTKQQKDQTEQAYLDEKAKTNKMQDKLIMSKTEIENASKYIEKLKQEKKDLQKKIKTKNSVVLQQESQIQQKQEQIEEQLKLLNEIRRETDRQFEGIHAQVTQLVAECALQNHASMSSNLNKGSRLADEIYVHLKEISRRLLLAIQECQKKDMEIKESTSLNQMLKTKLEESQKSLESNAQMISWLNKQLNEKGIGTSMMPSSFKNTTTSSAALNKPPLVSGVGISTGGFKPTFSSVDQLSSGQSTLSSQQKAGINQYERSPLRNTTNSLASQSPIVSMNTSTNSFAVNAPSAVGLNKNVTVQPKSFSYPLSKEPVPASNENQCTNLPVQTINPPQFVSKYTQQLYLQQQQQESQPKAIQSNVPSTGFSKQYSQSSLGSANQFQASNGSSECNFGSQPSSQILAGAMSFNPYSAGKYTGPSQVSEELQTKLASMKFSGTAQSNFDDDSSSHQEILSNNDTQMSGGDAFQAFLSKNEGGEEDDE